MYLTRMKLDISKRKTLVALSTPSMFHGAVEQAFQGERRRTLWRIDKLREEQYLLLLSEDKPDLTAAQEDFGVDSEEWVTKDYRPLLQKAVEGSKWHFRLVANPTYSMKQEGERGRVCAHTTTEHQLDWLRKQSLKHGFRLHDAAFDVAFSRWYKFSKGIKGKKISMLAVTFEGELEVTDQMVFQDALINGIGREKAYGVGMLTLVHL